MTAAPAIARAKTRMTSVRSGLMDDLLYEATFVASLTVVARDFFDLSMWAEVVDVPAKGLLSAKVPLDSSTAVSLRATHIGV